MCWHCRERGRFERREYKRVPWSTQFWVTRSETADHYVHVSRHDPSLVAYTASEEHGEADRQTRVAPGRYLTRFYGDVLTQKVIQYWCGKFKSDNDEGIALKFAHTPEDITGVYRNGPSSCMSGSADRFNTDGVHPASVYGAGDLAVAYIVNEGRITARAICWPEKNIFGRVYGDEYTLGPLLEKAGYELAMPHAFDGARLLRIEVSGGLVCPYLDVGSGRYVDVGREYLTVGAGACCADSTSGLLPMGTTTCPQCDERYDEDDGYYVSDAEENWCERCFCDHTTSCYVCGERYTDGHLTRVLADELVCERCLYRHYNYCEVCDQYHHRDDEPCATEEEEEEDGATIGATTPTINDPRQTEMPLDLWTT